VDLVWEAKREGSEIGHLIPCKGDSYPETYAQRTDEGDGFPLVFPFVVGYGRGRAWFLLFVHVSPRDEGL
jgi:hypothetical protein